MSSSVGALRGAPPGLVAAADAWEAMYAADGAAFSALCHAALDAAARGARGARAAGGAGCATPGALRAALEEGRVTAAQAECARGGLEWVYCAVARRRSSPKALGRALAPYAAAGGGGGGGGGGGAAAAAAAAVVSTWASRAAAVLAGIEGAPRPPPGHVHAVTRCGWQVGAVVAAGGGAGGAGGAFVRLRLETAAGEALQLEVDAAQVQALLAAVGEARGALDALGGGASAAAGVS